MWICNTCKATPRNLLAAELREIQPWPRKFSISLLHSRAEGNVPWAIQIVPAHPLHCPAHICRYKRGSVRKLLSFMEAAIIYGSCYYLWKLLSFMEAAIICGGVAYLLLRLQICIFSASLISSSLKSGCATEMIFSHFSQAESPFKFTLPNSVTK